MATSRKPAILAALKVVQYGTRLTAAAILSVSLSPAYAIDKEGNYTTYGMGTKSCASYLKEANSRSGPFDEVDYSNWLGGFISAHNYYVEGFSNVLATTDIQGALGWLKNWCRDNPIETFEKAARNLIIFLKVRAIIGAPSSSSREIPMGSGDAGYLPENGPATGWTVVETTRPTRQAVSPSAAVRSVEVKYRGAINLAPFKCDPVTRSSFVQEVCYDAKNAYMLINLNSIWYHYCEIDRGTVAGLLSADSIGRYFNASVKGRFDCRTRRVPAY